MPEPGLLPPLDPSQYPAYLDLQKKQMLAQALMGSAQQQAQTPADWNSMRIVPRRSMLSNLSTLTTALMAGKAFKGSQDALKNYYMGMAGQPSAAPAPSPASQEPQSEPPPLLARPDQPPSAQPPAASAPSQNSLLLPGTDMATSNRLYMMMGQQEYGKALAGQYAPTDLEKTLRAAGIPQSQWGPILQANIQKQNYIAPTAVRAGSVALGPDGQPKFFNPNTPQGSMPQFGPNGFPTAITPIPGGQQAIEDTERSQTLGKTEGQFNVLPTAGGGSAIVGGPGSASTAGAAGGVQAPRVAAPGGFQRPSQPLPGAWGTMPRLPVSSALGAPDEFTKGRLQEAGKKDAELSSKYGNEADLADQKLQYNAEALKALPTAEVGPLSEWMTENRAKLLELGVSPTLIPGSGKITPTMELNKNLKQSALQGARAIFGSRMTQMEVRLQHEELSPSTAMTHDAIASLMQQDTIKQQYAKQRSQDYGKYVQNGGDPLRFESWYAKTFPLTMFAAKAVTPPAAIERVQKNPALLPDFKAKYGWDPSAQ